MTPAPLRFNARRLAKGGLLPSASLLAAMSILFATASCGRREAEAPVPPHAPAEAAEHGGHEEMPETVRLSTAAMAEAGIATWKVQPVDLQHLLILNGAVDYNENRLLKLAANVRGRV